MSDYPIWVSSEDVDAQWGQGVCRVCGKSFDDGDCESGLCSDCENRIRDVAKDLAEILWQTDDSYLNRVLEELFPKNVMDALDSSYYNL